MTQFNQTEYLNCEFMMFDLYIYLNFYYLKLKSYKN